MTHRRRSQRSTILKLWELSPPVASLAVIGIIGLLTSTMSARLLSPAGRGDLLAIQVVPLFLAALSAGGLPESILFARPIGATPPGMKRVAIAIMAKYSLLAILFGWTYLFLFRRHSDVLLPAVITVVIAPLAAAYEVTIAFARRAGRVLLWATLRLATPVIWLVILGIGLVARIRSAPILSYIQISAYAVLATGAVVALTRLDSPRATYVQSTDLVRKARATVVGQSFKVLTLRLDLLLMPSIATNVQSGWYATATSWSWLATPWLTGLSSALTPFLQRRAGWVDKAATRRLLLLGVASSAAIAFGGLVLTRLLFSRIYGAAFGPAIVVAELLMAAAAIAAYNLWAAELARNRGRMWIPAICELPSIAVFLVVLFGWKQSMGAPKAAALGSLLGYSTTAVLLTIAVWNSRRAPEPTDAIDAEGDVHPSTTDIV
jgi:O-antigen/teichoic acid export membrane protein